nr:hypothetical protein [Tanacetum cinerariifolium]
QRDKRTRLIVESIHIRFDKIKEAPETSVANNTSGLVPQRQKASDYDNPDPIPKRQDVSSSADADVPSQHVRNKKITTWASLCLSSGNISSLAVGKYSGSGIFITGSGNDLSILFPTYLIILRFHSCGSKDKNTKGESKEKRTTMVINVPMVNDDCDSENP